MATRTRVADIFQTVDAAFKLKSLLLMSTKPAFGDNRLTFVFSCLIKRPLSPPSSRWKSLYKLYHENATSPGKLHCCTIMYNIYYACNQWHTSLKDFHTSTYTSMYLRSCKAIRIYIILVIKLCISIPNYDMSFIPIYIYVFYEPIASA